MRGFGLGGLVMVGGWVNVCVYMCVHLYIRPFLRQMLFALVGGKVRLVGVWYVL